MLSAQEESDIRDLMVHKSGNTIESNDITLTELIDCLNNIMEGSAVYYQLIEDGRVYRESL